MAASSAQALSHLWPIGSRVTDAGRLELGGCDAVDLAQEHGTPVYVMAEEDLRARARTLRDALTERHKDGQVLYASKAMPATAVLKVFAQEGLGCDVASGGELHLALNAGFQPDRLVFHGNAKSRRELTEARAAGVGLIVLDSLDEIDRLEAIVEVDEGPPQAVLVRVNPNVAPETHAKIATGQADSKFGLSMADAPAAIARAQASPQLDLHGLHAHLGSQVFELDVYRRGLTAMAALGDFRVWNLGGGLAAAYTSDEAAPALEDYVAAKVRALHEIVGSDVRLLIEPGRALVAHAGVTLYTVETVKENVSTWVAVDGGMSDNLRPMLYEAPYDAVVADRVTAPATTHVRLAGKHCESGDVLIQDVALADPRPGDIVAVPVTGAYGHAMANNYNGVARPPVVFVGGGESRVVVRRETYEDLTARDV